MAEWAREQEVRDLRKQVAGLQTEIERLRNIVREQNTEITRQRVEIEGIRKCLGELIDISDDRGIRLGDLHAQLVEAVKIVTRWHEHQTAPHADCGCTDCAALAKIRAMGPGVVDQSPEGHAGSAPVVMHACTHGRPASSDAPRAQGVAATSAFPHGHELDPPPEVLPAVPEKNMGSPDDDERKMDEE